MSTVIVMLRAGPLEALACGTLLDAVCILFASLAVTQLLLLAV